MFTTFTQGIARTVIGTIGAVVVATTFIVAAAGPAVAAPVAAITASAPVTNP